MEPELRAVYRSPRAPLAGAPAARAMRQAVQAGPICIVPRQIEPAVAAALDELPLAGLPAFDVSGPLERVRAGIAAALPVAPERPVLTWLRDDILTLLDLYAATVGGRAVRARLKAVADDMCRAFHVDQVGYRLVTTYRGPGTQWLASDGLARGSHGQPLEPGTIRELERGTVAILRGARDATPERPALLHRSPPIAGTGITRLFLAIDDGAA